MSRLEQLQHLPRSGDNGIGQPCQPADMDAVGAIRAAGLEPMQEYDFIAYFAHRDVEVPDVLELFRKLCQLVVVRREDGLAAERVMETLRDSPRDRDAVVGRGAAA